MIACSPALKAPASLAQNDRSSQFCQVSLPSNWAQAISAHLIKSRGAEGFVPLAVSPDGLEVFTSEYSNAWSGVVRVSTRTGESFPIRRFDKPNDQSIAGVGDGRWLVWTDDHSSTDQSEWDLRAWNADTNVVRDIAHVPRVGGAPIPGPYLY